MKKATIIVCLLLAGLGQNVFGQIGIDQAFSQVDGGAINKPWNVSLTVADNENRLLVVGISMEANVSQGGLDAISTITYAGQSLTKVVDAGIASGDWTNDNEFWIMVAPPVGTTNITVTYKSGNDLYNPTMAVYSLFGAQQTNLVPSSFNTATGSGAAISATLTGLSPNSMVIDQVVGGFSAVTYSDGSGQINTTYTADGSQRVRGGYLFGLSGASHTATYIPSGIMSRQTIAVLEVKESATTGGQGGVWTAQGDDIHFSTGNVGIGTSTPSAMLEVNGTIRSEEVRVEAVNAPDYVFEADYDLRSLREIEEYIQEFGHLPEVPSAAELEEKGMGVSEMNLLLLKKIEELTLYLLEAKGENMELKYRIEQLESRIK